MAICVVLVPAVAVGAAGVPVKVGEAMGALPLKVLQPAAVRSPGTPEAAAAMLMAGVVPPLETTGAVPVTLVTPPEAGVVQARVPLVSVEESTGPMEAGTAPGIVRT